MKVNFFLVNDTGTLGKEILSSPTYTSETYDLPTILSLVIKVKDDVFCLLYQNPCSDCGTRLACMGQILQMNVDAHGKSREHGRSIK